jgi:hypothetical protein
MTNNRDRGSVLATIEAAVRREVEMVLLAEEGTGRSWRRSAGGIRGSYYARVG